MKFLNALPEVDGQARCVSSSSCQFLSSNYYVHSSVQLSVLYLHLHHLLPRPQKPLESAKLLSFSPTMKPARSQTTNWSMTKTLGLMNPLRAALNSRQILTATPRRYLFPILRLRSCVLIRAGAEHATPAAHVDAELRPPTRWTRKRQ
jgi:hypothetical protein